MEGLRCVTCREVDSTGTNSTINSRTGFPTTHAFVWNGTHMLDVGSLGGTLALGAGGSSKDLCGPGSNLSSVSCKK